jgi:hypothetical protein
MERKEIAELLKKIQTLQLRVGIPRHCTANARLATCQQRFNNEIHCEATREDSLSLAKNKSKNLYACLSLIINLAKFDSSDAKDIVYSYWGPGVACS